MRTGRPRDALDGRRGWSLYASWRLGKLSLNSAAARLGVERTTLRFRWAEVDEEFAMWRARKLAQIRARAARRAA